MDNAYVLRDVLFVGINSNNLTRGDIVLSACGVIAAIGTSNTAEFQAIHEIRAEGRFVVLPSLQNAYVINKSVQLNGHATPSTEQDALASVRAVLDSSLSSGVSKVYIDKQTLGAAGGLEVVQRSSSLVEVVAVQTRPADVVCVRADTFQQSTPSGIAEGSFRIGTGDLTVTDANIWEEIRAVMLSTAQSGRPLDGLQLLKAVSSHDIDTNSPADLVVLHLGQHWPISPATILQVLLRASSSDVCGVFSQSKLVYKTQSLAERVFTTNPLKSDHVKSTNGVKKPHPSPADVVDRPLGSAECEFDDIKDAIDDIAAGKFVVVVDNEDRENEGDLIIAAEAMTTEKMAFMIRFCSGLICVSMLRSRLEELELPLMVKANNESFQTAFTTSVDFIQGTTTGISASDRAVTARALADPNTVPSEFARPGHMFPLRYTPGGTLVRMGHTEATIDLCKLAGVAPCGVLCEIALDDGSMARRDYLRAFSRHYGIKLITIADIIRYRRKNNLLDI